MRLAAWTKSRIAATTCADGGATRSPTTAIKYVAGMQGDLDKHCSDIAIGDGRIAKCLQKNQATLAPDCQQALKDTQMEIK